MFPVRDAVPVRIRPIVTLVTIAITVVVFCAARLVFPADEVRMAAAHTGVVPAELSWLAFVTSLAWPIGWLQLIAGAWCLAIFGPTVEDRLGHARFAILYLLSGAAGALTVVWAHPASFTPICGPAGAMAGIVGAHFALYPRGRVLMLVPMVTGFECVDVPSLLVSGLWLMLELAGSLAPGLYAPGWLPSMTVLQLAGGLFAGAIAGRILRRADRMRVEWWNG